MLSSLIYSPWNLLWIISIIGIWARFIEPKLLGVTTLSLPLTRLPRELQGFKILQLSDLHFSSHISDSYLTKILAKVKTLKPDLIVFTGDFLCDGKITDREKLQQFLNELQAPYGSFAIFGNHDYSPSVAVNDQGDYDIRNSESPLFSQVFKRIFFTQKLTRKRSERVEEIQPHQELISILKDTPLILLDNNTEVVKVGNAGLNITGLGEYMLGRANPEKAFANYDRSYPGLILAHNPDTFPLLENYPGEVVLSGHTHGGQVYLPWVWKKLTVIENLRYRYGLIKENNKTMFVSRGIAGLVPIRLFCKPELVLMELCPL